MNAIIGIYDNHDLAVEAVVKLKDSGYPVSQLTIMGMAESESVDKDLHITARNPIKVAGLEAGTLIGATLGILTGVGIFAIPGLGFLYGAGALVGAIAGVDFGIIGGGIASALATAGVKDKNAQKYHEALAAGKFIVIAHGSAADAAKAKDLLEEHGAHEDIELH